MSSVTENSSYRASQRAKTWRYSGLALTCALLFTMPVWFLLYSWQTVDLTLWIHLLSAQMGGLLSNTFWLCLWVTLGVSVLGTGLAWLTSMFEFKGSRVFEWALVLPLAMPAYVMAFVYVGQLDYSGPIQLAFRNWFGTSDFFPQVRGRLGVTLCFILVLYPYVYLLARSAFLSQSAHLFESAQSLGLRPIKVFVRLAIPIAKPAIVAGTALALMETLADFGTVSIFNYDTFTTAIYKAWYGFFSLGTAAQLSTGLLALVVLILLLEKKLVGSLSAQSAKKPISAKRIKLRGRKSVMAWCACMLVLFFSFVLPMLQLVSWAITHFYAVVDDRFFSRLSRSLFLGGVSAVLVVGFAVFFAYCRRQDQRPWVRFSVRLATIGYIFPGSILAVGLMLWFTWLDGLLVGLFPFVGNRPLFVGTVFSLMCAYVIRFMAVAYGPVSDAMQRIKPSLFEVVQSLQVRRRRFLVKILLPLLTPGLLSAGLLVFVDIMKEMPATLLLRPFGWDTLAVKIYEYTSEGEWGLAAVPGLSLVLLGLLPVSIIIRWSGSEHGRVTRPIQLKEPSL